MQWDLSVCWSMQDSTVVMYTNDLNEAYPNFSGGDTTSLATTTGRFSHWARGYGRSHTANISAH